MTEDEWLDFIMEHTIEAEAPSYELLAACLEAAPAEARRIYEFFETWIWQDWCEANFPPAPPPTPQEEAELEFRIAETLARFRQMCPARAKVH